MSRNSDGLRSKLPSALIDIKIRRELSRGYRGVREPFQYFVGLAGFIWKSMTTVLGMPFISLYPLDLKNLS